eukprot:9478784-Pyramimonas_sp.AAC.1
MHGAGLLGLSSGPLVATAGRSLENWYVWTPGRVVGRVAAEASQRANAAAPAASKRVGGGRSTATSLRTVSSSASASVPARARSQMSSALKP